MDHFEKQEECEVLEEFEIDGKPAKIVVLGMDDIGTKDLEEHAMNLADTNFKLLKDVPAASMRATVRSRMFSTREAMGKIPVVGSVIKDSKGLQEMMDRVYPDFSHEEHFRMYKNGSFPTLISNGQLLGVEMDGRIIAVQGFHKYDEKTRTGRTVYDFMKASTSKEFRGQRLSPRLKKLIYDRVMKEDPDAVWGALSANNKHLEKFAERGWHIVGMNDPNEIVQVIWNGDPKYHELMMGQGYKAVYLDPKVDEAKWE